MRMALGWYSKKEVNITRYNLYLHIYIGMKVQQQNKK